MPTPRLTRKQSHLLNELNSLSELFGLDFFNIQGYEPDARTTKLEEMKRHMVRGQVIAWYTLVDEFLNMMICHYYFGKKQSFPKLWKTKRFRLFNHHILENLYPLQKLQLVNEIKKVPSPIYKSIQDLNNVRNGFAHNFFFENTKKAKVTWKGHSILSIEGAQAFMEDMDVIFNYFLHLRG